MAVCQQHHEAICFANERSVTAPLKKKRRLEMVSSTALRQRSASDANLSTRTTAIDDDDDDCEDDREDSPPQPNFSVTFDDSNIDPELLNDEGGTSGPNRRPTVEESTALQDLVFPSGQQSDGTDEDEGDSPESDIMLEVGGVDARGILALPSVELVNHLARFNVVRLKEYGSGYAKNGNPAIKAALQAKFTVSGNSRDEPTPYQLLCTRTPGCKYTTSVPHSLKTHENTCNPAAVESKQKKEAEG